MRLKKELGNLDVKSFVTTFEQWESSTIKGGEVTDAFSGGVCEGTKDQTHISCVPTCNCVPIPTQICPENQN